MAQSARAAMRNDKVSPRLDYQEKNGAQGRDRTADTAIFSRMLYQLSYLGTRALEACL